MKRLFLMIVLSASLLGANEEANNALGGVVSSGFGSGISYRSLDNEGYSQHAFTIFGSKNDERSEFYINYGFSLGHYLYSATSNFHLKTIAGVDIGFEEDTFFTSQAESKARLNENGDDSNKDIFAITGAGFGIEYGSRKAGGVLLALDLMYRIRVSQERTEVGPGMGIELFFNW
jgi:hypothetical protein